MTLPGAEHRAQASGAPSPAEYSETTIDLAVEFAHDLRTPLSAILVLAELLETGRSGPLDAEQRRQVRLIRSAVQSLCAVTDDVMELARSGAALTMAAPMRLLLPEVLASVADISRPMAAVRSLELRTRCSVTVPRIGNARALERVLLNLVTNALKFTDDGFVEVDARVEDATSPMVCFTVRDTGRGIANVAARPGAGLGLLVCRRLVSAMGGTLRLDSRVRQGSRFYFSIPLASADD